jgi:SAM-dependent methyltransferase
LSASGPHHYLSQCHARSVGVYASVNEAVLTRIPPTSRNILDLGCGNGALGGVLKHRQSCRVVGVTISEEEAELSERRLDVVWLADLESFEFPPGERFDCVICSHVLEHLVRPDALLSRLSLSGALESGGVLVVALPNVLHWRQRLRFLRGEFRYTDWGLMDRTHLRFYDFTSAQELVCGSGFEISEASVDGHFPILWRLDDIGAAFDHAALKAFPGVFGFQIILVCRPDR